MQPSRRPQATAFQPVNGTSNDNTMSVPSNIAASPSLEDRFAGLSGGNNNSNSRKSNTNNDHNHNNNNNMERHEGNSLGSSSNQESNTSAYQQQQQQQQQQQHSSLDPAKFSVTVRGNDMSAKLSSVTHRLMAQIKNISALRDTFENQRENFVSQKICTLSRQLESLYSEASDVIGLMVSEDPKMMPSKGFGKKNDHGNDDAFNAINNNNNILEEQNKNKNNNNNNNGSSPNNRNNNNNNNNNAANTIGSTTLLKNIGGNMNNNNNDDNNNNNNNNNVSSSSPSSILSLLQQHQQQGGGATVPVSNNNNNNNNNNAMKGSRRPVAVPFSQQQQQNNNNNQNDDNNSTTHRTPTLQGNGTSTTSASSAMYLPGIANLDLNSNNNNNNNSNMNSASSTQSAIQLLQHFQQNNNNNNTNNNTQGHHHHQNNNNQNNNKQNRQNFDLNPPPPLPPPPPASQQHQQQSATAPKFVRATTVITQAEHQQQQGIPITDAPLHQLQPSSGSGGGNGNNTNNGNGNDHHSAAAVITSATAATAISAHQANLQGLNANGEQTFPGNPHRRLNRGEAHHFCVVEFKCNRMKRYPFDRSQDNVRPGHYIICWGDKGEDCGLCVMTGFCDETGAHSDMKTFRDANVELHKVRILSDIFILRNASREEVATLHGSLAKLEEAALQRCQEMAAQRGLTMRFTDCEIQFDRQKFTFYFDACSSVDFRDLTRDLHRIFKARIWLENINGNVKNVVPEGAISQADKKMFAARGVQLKFR